MPELPEVETIVRGLNRFIPGKTIRSVEIRHKKIAARHGEKPFRMLLTGQTFKRVERKGKFLYFRFESGRSLIVHLRMTGKFIAHSRGTVPKNKHIRLVMHFRDGSALIYNDLRIFGSFHIIEAGEEITDFQNLGRDPIQEKIDTDWFLRQCARRSVPMKVLLLDQKVLAGIGNIYACEALFRSKLSPLLPAHRLRNAKAEELLKAIRRLLLLAIRHNGTSVQDFRDVDDQTGAFQRLLKVYGRENEPCTICNTKIRRIKQAQRSTFYCPKCQASGIAEKEIRHPSQRDGAK